MTLPRSLRGQLILTFTGVTAVVLLAAAVSTSLLLEHAVWGPLDAALGEELETLAEMPPQDFAAAVARVGGETDLGGEKFIRVLAADGRTLAASGVIPDAVGVLAPPARPGRRPVTVGRRHAVYRVVWSTAADGGWSEIGVRATSQLRTIWRARLAIAVGAALLLAALVALAWAIASRATGELDRLGAELESVEAGSLDRRLAPRRTAEVDRLAAVLNRLLARLEAAVEYLRRFSADAAHELRTPIAALRAHLEVALARPRSTSAYHDGLLDALEQTERLERLAADLLTLSAVETGLGRADVGAETVRLDAVAREVAEFLEPVAQEQGRYFTCEARQAVAVRGAPELLKRVLLNLVDNAFRHTPHDAAVRVTVRAEDHTAMLQVNDGGPGMAPEDVPHAFERFRRGRGAGAGAGLGLALCREIVAQHQGRIELATTVGAGTSVTVSLPLADAGPET